MEFASDTVKREKYLALYAQVASLCDVTLPAITNLSNFIAALHQTFDWWWTGFYIVKGDQLILGPFQGPVACTIIGKGKGVCGTAWLEGKSIVVPDVHTFPGHIACSSESQSEIVIPVYSSTGEVMGVLDVDSELPSHFDDEDRIHLEKLVALISSYLNPRLVA